MFVIRAYCNKFTHTKSRLCHVDFLRKNEKLRRKMKEIKNPPSPNTLVLIKRINQRKYNSSTHNFFAFLPFEKRERGRERERERDQTTRLGRRHVPRVAGSGRSRERLSGVFSVLRTTERKCEEKGLNYYENDVSILDRRDEEEDERTTETPREERERER